MGSRCPAIVASLKRVEKLEAALRRTYVIFNRIGSNASLQSEIELLLGKIEVPVANDEH